MTSKKNGLIGMNPPAIIGVHPKKEEKKKTPSLITKEDINSKFEDWRNDESWKDINIDVDVFSPELIIELFVADLNDKSVLYTTEDFYVRPTPIARVLYVSDECSEKYKALQKGDLVVVDQGIVGQTINEKHEKYLEASKNSSFVAQGPPPPRVIKNLDAWLEKFYYSISNLHACLDMLSFDTDEFSGPYIFKVPQSFVKGKYLG